jgi:hypothetical protein
MNQSEYDTIESLVRKSAYCGFYVTLNGTICWEKIENGYLVSIQPASNGRYFIKVLEKHFLAEDLKKFLTSFFIDFKEP